MAKSKDSTKAPVIHKKRKRKAANLSYQKRRKIAEFKVKNPNMTFYHIAEVNNVTYDQARRAYLDYQAGKFTCAGSKGKKVAFDPEMTLESADLLLEKQYQNAVQALNAADNIDIETRVKLTETLFSMRKTLQQLKLESFIKRADAGIIAIIIRKFRPEANDDEILRIYLEAVEVWKIQNR
jgi:hypothetical protein